MEFRNTQTCLYQNDLHTFESLDRDHELTRQRLETLLAINAERARERSLYPTRREKLEADMMKNPVSIERAFAYLGFLLGAFPPAALFTRLVLDVKTFRREDAWVLGMMLIVNVVSAIVGFFSGKMIGKIVRESEKLSWTKMILVLPFIGIVWGILAGGAGGLFVFVIGAFFGAFLGALVGAFALPLFTIFHRSVKRGDKIERKHFLPLAFGTSLIISAFFLGL